MGVAAAAGVTVRARVGVADAAGFRARFRVRMEPLLPW